MIQKKIHFIWLGRNKKDRVSQICLNSWKIYLKDYEIIEWNEDNLPLDLIAKNNLFFYFCKKYKLWAFMSDYLRLWVLYNEGGIYMDTDVQVLKSFDSLLQKKMFMGYELNDYIGTGIIGAEKGNPLVKELLDFYENQIWKVSFYQNPLIFSSVLKRKPSLYKYCEIMERDYFSPYDPYKDYSHEIVQTDKTYTIHWFNANWGMTRKGYVFLNTKQYHGLRKFFEILRKNIGYELRVKGLKPF